MKTAYIRLYSEEELQRRLKQTEAMLREIYWDTYYRFDYYSRLEPMWLKYELTKYIVSESVIDDNLESWCPLNPHCLFIESDVEDSFSEKLKDAGTLLKGLDTIHSLCKSIQSSIHIDSSFYENKYMLVLQLASDIMCHFNAKNFNRQKMMHILSHLNHMFLNDYEVSYERVLDYAITEKYRSKMWLNDLIQKLNLIDDEA